MKNSYLRRKINYYFGDKNFPSEIKRRKVKTLQDLVYESAKKFKTRSYIRYLNDKNEICNISYQETARIFESFASWLNKIQRSIDSSRQLYVGIIGEGTLNYVIAYFATVFGGQVTVPIDPNSDPETIVYCVNKGDIDILFYDESLKSKIEYIKDKCPKVKKYLLINKSQDQNQDQVHDQNENENVKDNEINLDDEDCIEDILKNYEGKKVNKKVLPSQNAFIIFTSGTTGNKKGVVLTQDSVIDRVYSLVFVKNSRYNIFMNILPLYHIFSSGDFLYSMRLGYTVCLSYDLSKLLQNIQIFQPSLIVCVPLIAKNLFNGYSKIRKLYPSLSVEDAKKKIFGEKLHSLYVGGSYFLKDMIVKYDEIGIFVSHGYGLTETNGNGTQSDYQPSKFGSVGKSPLGFRTRTVKGEIQIKSKSLMKEYYKDPEKTKEAFTSDGWFRTGDMGYIDKDGYHYITGRIKNLIILSNGENVAPERLENIYNNESFIQEIIIYGDNDVLCSEIYPNEDYIKLNNIPPEEVKDKLWKIIEEKNKDLPPHERIAKLSIRNVPFIKTPSKKIIRSKFLEEVKERKRVESEKSKSSQALPITELQEKLYQSISQILNNKDFGVSSNLYEFGLNSMSCTMLVNDIRQEFNVLITLAEVINNPSVLQLEYFINNYNSENHNVIDKLKKKLSSSKMNCPVVRARQSLILKNKKSLGNSNVKVNINAKNNTYNESISYAEDVELLDDPKISSKNLPDLKFPNSNGTLFLTGATGFLGAHILATYLEKNPLGKVYCLVRGKNDKEAMRRLKQNNQTYMTWKDSWNKGENQNVIAICGDLSKEKFGLSSHQWYRLCHDVDLIIHSGAMVHWIYPYAQLKPINVLSTIQCLTMASTHHLKPFYFVSSVSVLNNMEFLKKTNSGETVIIQENDDLESSRTGLLNGYGQSKWVSEKLIMKAIERGIPACIIRPGFILGHSQNGMLNTDDFIIRMMAGCAQLKLFPDISSILNTCPVDYVASAIIRIASQEKWLSHNVYHMWNTPCISFNDIFEEMQLHGYNIKKVNYEEWCQTLKELNINHALENNALYPLLHFVLNDLTASSNTPLLNDDNTREAIANSDVPIHNIKDLIGKYIAYLINVGILDSPSEQNAIKSIPDIGEISITKTVGRHHQL